MLRFHTLQVSEVRPEAEEAIVVTLTVPEPLQAEFKALPGQHVVLRAVVEGEELRRTYSLLDVSHPETLRIAVRLHPNGRFSQYLGGSIKSGDSLDVMPPNGAFGPRRVTESGALYVAFASGCGITPVIASIRFLLEQSSRNRVMLFYGNRTTARTMLLEELHGLKDRYLDRLTLHFLMSREPQEVQLYNGRLDAEKVRALSSAFFDPRAVDQYFICGPGNMNEVVAGALRELGVEAERIHGEHFAAVAPAGSTVIESAEQTAAGGTHVVVNMDGRRRTFVMPSREESILEAATRAGLDLPFSCKAGVCSTCRTKLIRGEVRLAQNYALEEWELAEGFILACQAHPLTAEIELDYDGG